jgi:hypothetical protein
MVSVCIRADVQELSNFLREGGEYPSGPPNAPDVIALRGALENVLANTADQNALAVIKSAVSDGSWFRIVVEKHQTPNDSIEFKGAKELCESLAASLQFVTDDSTVPDMSVTQIWKDLYINPARPYAECLLFQEMDMYCTLMRIISGYILHVANGFLQHEADKLLPTCQDKVDELRQTYAKFPAGSQLLRMILPRKRATSYEEHATTDLHWMYNTSYEEFSNTNEFSRSALLANLPALMAQVDTCKQEFQETFQHDQQLSYAMTILDSKHECCGNAYKAWLALAESKVRGSFRATQVRKWEVGGHRPACASLAQMLHELLHVW